MANKRFFQQQSITNISEMSQQKPDQKPYTLRIIRIREFSKKSSLSVAWIYDRMNPQSPNHQTGMPKRIWLSGVPGKGPVGFLESEVDKWLLSLAEKSLANMEGAA